ncbi:MAG: VOC family protein [Alphaproteobacteria bacterium]|nr:VOC family protein [Alphaproteobacteria bacterium]
MNLGAFSVSLAVKDLAASRRFYETLGFTVFGGEADQGWLILRNGDTTIGLFQGMFDRNILTFNPGFAQDMSFPEAFTDVRELETALRKAGVDIQESTTAKSPSGPAHIVLTDPDGNPVLIDQHR